MSRRSLLLVVLLIGLSLAASYGLRFGLMEDGRWVGLCGEQAARWECQLRSGLGLLIHFRVIAGLALGLSLLAFCVPRRNGWRLAVLALMCAIPALILYSASLAVFAVVLAGLRLVRNAPAGSPQTAS
ncbi:hypothetical protein [Pseudomonas sp. N040]|uniref:hypothetical protein n=1 Tax=Pseudomonas sp. N040 TaxID=2785325 RepID=UPI0018A25D8F|nr:hypothetical protein [Pseudomonas sp. N040]MBF7731454.1 hypothetical protein [Pseudomonas sp. N040]MBW7015098.1 hypothetical protein [Pseudomonas sp. N040]